MKKIFIISIGILILFLIVGAWAYLMLHGKPEGTAQIFTRFGSDGEERVAVELINETPQTIVDTASERLKQLTTRPVAGAQFTDTGIRFIEQGTGHLYEIDLHTGESLLISSHTVPQTTEAMFSSDAQHVAITSFNESGTATLIGSISTTTEGYLLNRRTLISNASELSFNASNTHAYFLLKQSNRAVGHMYDLQKGTDEIVFTIPLRDVHVVWGSPLYVYTTPTATQIGHVYKVSGKSSLEYITTGRRGLVAHPYENGLVVTSITSEEISSMTVPKAGDSVLQTLPFIPEKCANDPLDTNFVLCGVPTNLESAAFPDNWYIGTVAYDDVLWEMDLGAGTAISLLNFATESGRTMDIKKTGADRLGLKFYFINKNDNTLWMFDRSVR